MLQTQKTPVNRSPTSSFPTFCIKSCIPTSLSMSSSYAEPSFPYETHPTQALPAHTFHTSSAATRRNGSKLSPHINAIMQNSNESLQISLESFFKQRRMLLFSPTLRAFLPRPAVLLLGTSNGASIPRTHLLGGSRSTESHSKTLSALFYAPQDPFLSYRFPSKLVPFSS